jgi:aminopeptidase N
LSTESSKTRVAEVIAHELAHQWFGNLVTMKWWSDLWLNEGFAEFMEYKAVDAVEPKWQMLDQFIPFDFVRALHADESRYTHKIAVQVGNPNEISSIFDDISYGKGSRFSSLT